MVSLATMAWVEMTACMELLSYHLGIGYAAGGSKSFVARHVRRGLDESHRDVKTW